MTQEIKFKSLRQTLDEKIWRKQRYEALSETESGHSTSSREHRMEQRRRWTIFIAAVILFFLVAAIGLSATAAIHRRHPTTFDQCGTTPEEARARGCHFEMTLSLWVPEDCYDRELETEYLQDPGLVYYRDIHFTEEVPFNEVKRGEVYAWFVPWEHHIRHCAFSLRKFHRAAERGGKLDGYVLSYNHTMHCIMMMTEPSEDLVKLPQRDVRMYPYCGRRGGYNVDKTRRFQWTD